MSITSQVCILFIVVLVGAACRKLGFFNDATIQGVTKLVVNITVPCLMISNMQRPFDLTVLRNFLITLALSAAVILGSIALGLFLFKKRSHDKRAVLANLMGFSNCGFMGYPIILAINPDWMIYAVAYNVAFTFITWTVGVSLYQGRQNANLRRVLLNPNVIATAIGFTLFCLSFTLPKIPGEVFSMLGGLTTPLTMLLIGTRMVGLNLRDLMDADYHISAALRLLVLPLIVFEALRPFPLDPAVYRTMFLLTAMPAGTMTAMQAELYGGDAVFASRAIAYSTLLSLLTVPLIGMLL